LEVNEVCESLGCARRVASLFSDETLLAKQHEEKSEKFLMKHLQGCASLEPDVDILHVKAIRRVPNL
jgi:hypothetical protein